MQTTNCTDSRHSRLHHYSRRSPINDQGVHAFDSCGVYALIFIDRVGFLPKEVVRFTISIATVPQPIAPRCGSSCFKRAQLGARDKDPQMASAERKRSTSVLENENIVQLNVGGTVFLTTRDTLLVDTASYFSSLLNGHYRPDVDSFGKPCYFIDRDPTHFRHIL